MVLDVATAETMPDEDATAETMLEEVERVATAETMLEEIETAETEESHEHRLGQLATDCVNRLEVHEFRHPMQEMMAQTVKVPLDQAGQQQAVQQAVQQVMAMVPQVADAGCACRVVAGLKQTTAIQPLVL